MSKMSYLKYFLFQAIILLFSSCNSSNQRHVKNGLKLPLTETIISSITDRFELSDVIVLQTNDSCLISNINRIIIHNKFLIILNDYKEVLLFDYDNGNFLFSINKRGIGPGEYNRIMDITFNYDNEQIVIYSDTKNILFYDINGNYIKSKHISEDLYEKFSYADKKLFFYNPLSVEKGYLIRIFCVIENKWLSNIGDAKENFNIRLNGVPIVRSKSIWFANPLKNYLSAINGNISKNHYEIDVENFAHADEVLSLQNNPVNFFREVHKQNIVYAFTSIKETNNFLYFKSNLHPFICLDKNNQQIFWFEELADNELGVTNLQYFSHDSDDDNIMFISEAKNWSGNSKQTDKLPLNVQMVVKNISIKEDSNPLLIFYKEK